MADGGIRGAVGRHALAVTGILSAVGYGLVLGTFLGLVPGGVYPELSLAMVNRLSDAIAAINSVATLSLVLGWYWIRRGEVRKHRAAMLTAFGLILLFLVLYLLKVGGGGTKEFVGPTLPYYAYLAMLAIHILLSVVAVPVVLYQVVTGLTHRPAALRRRTSHVRIGRIAATAWIISLSLGVATYLLLNHVYGWEFIEAGVVMLGLPAGSRGPGAGRPAGSRHERT